MAEVTVVPEKVEKVVTEKGHVLLKLSPEEAQALRTLLYTGVGSGTVSELGLSDLNYLLGDRGIDNDSPEWHNISNLKSVVNP